MEKAVCYCVTRNLYADVAVSARSLYDSSNHNDLQIYIIAEDDDIDQQLPPGTKVLDMSRQTFFRTDGPNYNKKWTYMALMKTAMAWIFPDLPRILTLDHDTFITGDLSELWEMPMYRKYVAGCLEPYWKRLTGDNYINAGVLMWNLDEIRKDGIAYRMIEKLNTVDYRLPEQECINVVCRDGIAIIDSAYNLCDYVKPPDFPVKILHFAGKIGRESWMRKEIWGRGI